MFGGQLVRQRHQTSPSRAFHHDDTPRLITCTPTNIELMRCTVGYN